MGRGSFLMDAGSAPVCPQPGPSFGSIPSSPEFILGAQQLPEKGYRRKARPEPFLP